MNMALVIVNNYYDAFDFLLDGETPEEGIRRAEESRDKSIARYEEIMAGKYASTYFANQLEQEKHKTFEVMSLHEFSERQKAYLCSGEPEEISREDYENALNCLPPLGWMQGDSREWFFMSEMYTGTITNQHYYDKKTGKYYCKTVDICDRKTWIDLP